MKFEIPDRGVWLLTAGNGAGKTSLLACLRRIGTPNAFPIHFPVSLKSDALDDFSDATVVYDLGNRSVEYAYRGERWAPRPRKNSHLLKDFGYRNVIYLAASAERITPRPDDFVPRNVRAAPPTVVAAANEIFETEKFSDLRVINLTAGPGNRAYLLKVQENPPKYHSEKHFSLGELCVLKLLEGIRECSPRSLILIDELEIALHPRAQVKLFEYLSQVADEKRLTVIFSTHSVSLIKAVPRKYIIYLDRNDDGEIEVIRECFPTYAIGNITLGEERVPDRVIYVEDEVAKAIVDPLVRMVSREQFEGHRLAPDVRVIPIGGFEAVVHFLTHHGALLPPGTRGNALLDNDVHEETLQAWRRNNNHARLAEFQRVEDRLRYLPWTPEVGIVEEFSAHRREAELRLNEEFGTQAIRLVAGEFEAFGNLQGGQKRRRAKAILQALVTRISAQLGESREAVQKGVCKVFAAMAFDGDGNAITQLIMPNII